MLWLVIVVAIGLLGLTVAGRKGRDRRMVTRNLEVGHRKFTGRSETTRFPHITEKKRELH